MWQICTPRVFPVLFYDENTKLLFVVKLAIEAHCSSPVRVLALDSLVAERYLCDAVGEASIPTGD